MGYSYSTPASCPETSSTEKPTNATNPTWTDINEPIFILKHNDTVLSYHKNCNEVYRAAKKLAKRIGFKFMITHGSSNLMRLTEKMNDTGSVESIIIYTMPVNVVFRREQIYSNIQIQKINKLEREVSDDEESESESEEKEE